MYTATGSQTPQHPPSERPPAESGPAESGNDTVDLTAEEASEGRSHESDGSGVARGQRLASEAPLTETTRVVSRFRVWSVAKVSLLFFAVFAIVGVVAATVLWGAAAAVGIVGTIEGFMVGLGFEGFSFDALLLLRAAMIMNLAVMLAGVGTSVLAAILYNLVSRTFGGIEVVLSPRPSSVAEPARPA